MEKTKIDFIRDAERPHSGGIERLYEIEETYGNDVQPDIRQAIEYLERKQQDEREKSTLEISKKANRNSIIAIWIAGVTALAVIAQVIVAYLSETS